MKAARSLFTLALCTGVATAGPHPAEDAFERGRALMKQKKYADACAAFEQSYAVDAAFGTLFNLADCDVALGKLATALQRYRQLAHTDSNPDRRAMSERLANQLAPRVPRLLVTVEGHPAGAVLAIDGSAASDVGAEVPVDVGAHTISVTAPSFEPWRETVSVDHEGMHTNVVVKLVPIAIVESPAAAPPGAPSAEVHADAPDPGRRYGMITTIAGGVLVVGGLVAGGLAYSQWQHAQSCTGCDRPSESHGAVIRGDISSALVATGVVVSAVGIYLWRTSAGTATVTAALVPGRAGLSLSGSF